MSNILKNSFVLDCSLTMAWCFEDETSEYSEQVLSAVAKCSALVPALWPVEVSNSLTVAERRKRLSHVQSMAFREYLSVLMIEVDDYLLKKPIEIVHNLAQETGLTAYDATYLELAIRRNLPIATLDRELQQASHKIGIAIYLPEIANDLL